MKSTVILLLLFTFSIVHSQTVVSNVITDFSNLLEGTKPKPYHSTKNLTDQDFKTRTDMLQYFGVFTVLNQPIDKAYKRIDRNPRALRFQKYSKVWEDWFNKNQFNPEGHSRLQNVIDHFDDVTADSLLPRSISYAYFPSGEEGYIFPDQHLICRVTREPLHRTCNRVEIRIPEIYSDAAISQIFKVLFHDSPAVRPIINMSFLGKNVDYKYLWGFINYNPNQRYELDVAKRILSIEIEKMH